MGSLNPIDQLVWWVILAIVGIFGATLLGLRKVFFLPYIEVMERREVELEAAESVIAEAERVVAEAEPEAERIVAEARGKADELIRRTREEDDVYRQKTIETAMQESSAALEQGRAQIASARETEVTQLRLQAVECVTLACDKLLGSTDPDTVTAAVDKLLARRVH
jgi:F0F1-type ATP synthase membrane subunit b/b'